MKGGNCNTALDTIDQGSLQMDETSPHMIRSLRNVKQGYSIALCLRCVHSGGSIDFDGLTIALDPTSCYGSAIKAGLDNPYVIRLPYDANIDSLTSTNKDKSTFFTFPSGCNPTCTLKTDQCASALSAAVTNTGLMPGTIIIGAIQSSTIGWFLNVCYHCEDDGVNL